MPTKDTSTFMALPSELRVNIYKHILPVHTNPTDYSSLRRVCSLIRKEWKWEARNNILQEYDRFERYLASHGIRIHESAAEMLSISSITIELPFALFASPDPCALDLIPWHWTWITDVKIIFCQDCPAALHRSSLMYQIYDELDKAMNRYIEDQSSRRKLDQFTITNITLRWYDVPEFLFTRHRNKRTDNALLLWHVRTEKGEPGREHLSVVWQRLSKMELYKEVWTWRVLWWLSYVVAVMLLIQWEKGALCMAFPPILAISFEVYLAWRSFVYL